MKKDRRADKRIRISRTVAGGATGAVLGAVVGGPVGALAGGVVGGVLGAAEKGPSPMPSTTSERPERRNNGRSHSVKKRLTTKTRASAKGGRRKTKTVHAMKRMKK